MPIVECVECKQRISSDAQSCPGCGKRDPAPPGIIRKTIRAIGYVGGGSALLLIAMAAMKDGPASPHSVGPSAAAIVDVQNTKLSNDYTANEVASDERYKGRQLRVTGVVSAISKDVYDNTVIQLASPNEFQNTMAKLRDSQKGTAAQLVKGHQLQLLCKGDGLLIGSPMLSDCQIEKY